MKLTEKVSPEIFMKKYIFTLMLVLGLTVMASAATQNFDKFSIDVPAGWTAESDGNGNVTLTSSDNTAALVVFIGDNGGQSSQEIAEAASKGLNGTKPVPVKSGKGYTFDCKTDSGMDASMRVYTSDKEVIGLTIIGDTMKVLPVMNSIERK